MIYDSFLDFTSDNFLEIGTFQIKWYAVCILTGVILAAILGVREAKKFGIAPNLILDGVLICVPLAIIGARLYYVFTSWADFDKGNFVDTFLAIIGFTDNGTFELAGLAINGGILVALIFVPVYCKIRKINVFHVFDLLAPGLLIGQICGRWGNFFNQEAHGPNILERPSWLLNLVPDFIMDRMTFRSKVYDSALGDYIYKTATWHPTFFYEAIWNLIALVIILISRRKNKHQRVGDSVAFYLLWYGLGRALIIEPLRMDPLLFVQSAGPDILFNRVNVVINLVLAVIGLVWLILKHIKFKEPFYIEVQKEIKEKKIDGVIVRLEETLVSTSRLVANAYYYTAKEKMDVDLTDEQIKELMLKSPGEYFKDEESFNYYLEYFYSHLNQLEVVLNVKDFFKTLFKHDYKVSVVTSYNKEFAEYVLDLLNITSYVSVIIDKDVKINITSSDSEIVKSPVINPVEYGFEAIKEAKNILVISSLAADISLANSKNVTSCLVYYGSEIDNAMEYNPTHVINKADQLDNIIIE